MMDGTTVYYHPGSQEISWIVPQQSARGTVVVESGLPAVIDTEQHPVGPPVDGQNLEAEEFADQMLPLNEQQPHLFANESYSVYEQQLQQPYFDELEAPGDLNQQPNCIEHADGIWIEKETQEGYLYYLHSRTQETSWIKPLDSPNRMVITWTRLQAVLKSGGILTECITQVILTSYTNGNAVVSVFVMPEQNAEVTDTDMITTNQSYIPSTEDGTAPDFFVSHLPMSEEIECRADPLIGGTTSSNVASTVSNTARLPQNESVSSTAQSVTSLWPPLTPPPPPPPSPLPLFPPPPPPPPQSQAYPSDNGIHSQHMLFGHINGLPMSKMTLMTQDVDTALSQKKEPSPPPLPPMPPPDEDLFGQLWSPTELTSDVGSPVSIKLEDSPTLLPPMSPLDEATLLRILSSPEPITLPPMDGMSSQMQLLEDPALTPKTEPSSSPLPIDEGTVAISDVPMIDFLEQKVTEAANPVSPTKIPLPPMPPPLAPSLPPPLLPPLPPPLPPMPPPDDGTVAISDVPMIDFLEQKVTEAANPVSPTKIPLPPLPPPLPLSLPPPLLPPLPPPLPPIPPPDDDFPVSPKSEPPSSPSASPQEPDNSTLPISSLPMDGLVGQSTASIEQVNTPLSTSKGLLQPPLPPMPPPDDDDSTADADGSLMDLVGTLEEPPVPVAVESGLQCHSMQHADGMWVEAKAENGQKYYYHTCTMKKSSTRPKESDTLIVVTQDIFTEMTRSNTLPQVFKPPLPTSTPPMEYPDIRISPKREPEDVPNVITNPDFKAQAEGESSVQEVKKEVEEQPEITHEEVKVEQEDLKTEPEFENDGNTYNCVPISGSNWFLVRKKDGTIYFYNPKKKLTSCRCPKELARNIKVYKMLFKSLMRCYLHDPFVTGNVNDAAKIPEKYAAIPFSMRAVMFIGLMMENQMSSLPWFDMEIDKIEQDRRFFILTSEERQKVFDHFMQKMLSNKWLANQIRIYEAKQEFRKLLQTANVNSRSTYQEFVELNSNDQAFKGVQISSLREFYFEEYIAELKKEKKRKQKEIDDNKAASPLAFEPSAKKKRTDSSDTGICSRSIDIEKPSARVFSDKTSLPTFVSDTESNIEITGTEKCISENVCMTTNDVEPNLIKKIATPKVDNCNDSIPFPTYSDAGYIDTDEFLSENESIISTSVQSMSDKYGNICSLNKEKSKGFKYELPNEAMSEDNASQNSTDSSGVNYITTQLGILMRLETRCNAFNDQCSRDYPKASTSYEVDDKSRKRKMSRSERDALEIDDEPVIDNEKKRSLKKIFTMNRKS